MVEGVHFFPDVEPDSLGHKALAVNLSDLAAMGATPKWAMLALTVPKADEAWLEGFARGFFALAAEHDVDLIGGDTARGPRNILCVVMVTISACGTGDGCRPAATRPAMCAMSANSNAPQPRAISPMRAKSMIRE